MHNKSRSLVLFEWEINLFLKNVVTSEEKKMHCLILLTVDMKHLFISRFFQILNLCRNYDKL